MTHTGPEGLPLPDYDQLSLGELEHRIRALSHAQLEELVRHEREHAARTPVVELLASRIAQLDAGATPSPGGEPPAAGPGPAGGSPVSPATAGQPVHPPPHGTPDQPGRPKGDQRP